ncbi:MAG: SprT family zinc-dependent metalloprotease [Limisphaerales bacterium]
MFEQFFNFTKPAKLQPDHLQVGATVVPLLFVRHPRARRYLLRLQADGVARVTIPRRGSVSAGRDFAVRNIGWLGEQLKRQAAKPKTPTTWHIGTEVYFLGELARVELESRGWVRIGTELMKIADGVQDLKPAIQKHLHRLAAKEFPPRVMELAGAHGIQVTRVSVRNQKSRWGSCSRRGTISLNWRLIQCPFFVRDYIILHELAHRRQMNHSNKFWQEVERLCPDYRTAEAWVKQHAALMR